MPESASRPVPPIARRSSRTVEDVLPAYLEALEAEGMATHTVASARLDLRQLAQFLGRQSVGTVTLEDLRAFFAWLARQQGNGLASVRRKTSTVKRFFRHLHATERLDHDPSLGLVYPSVPRTTVTPLSGDEVDAIVAASGDGWRALVLCLVDAGLKRDELVALRAEDVEIIEGAEGPGRLHVRHRRASNRVRHRTLALTPRLAEALTPLVAAAEANGSGALFDLSGRGVDYIVEMCGQRGGVRPDQKLAPGMLRDAYAHARMRTFVAREADLVANPRLQREVRKEHDRLLLRELGLSETSNVAERCRELVGGPKRDRAEEG